MPWPHLFLRAAARACSLLAPSLDHSSSTDAHVLYRHTVHGGCVKRCILFLVCVLEETSFGRGVFMRSCSRSAFLFLSCFFLLYFFQFVLRLIDAAGTWARPAFSIGRRFVVRTCPSLPCPSRLEQKSHSALFRQTRSLIIQRPAAALNDDDGGHA